MGVVGFLVVWVHCRQEQLKVSGGVSCSFAKALAAILRDGNGTIIVRVVNVL